MGSSGGRAPVFPLEMQALASRPGVLGWKQDEVGSESDDQRGSVGIAGLGGDLAELAGAVTLIRFMVMRRGQEGQQAEKVQQQTRQ